MNYINQRFIFDPSLVLYLPLYQVDGSSFMSQDAYGHTCTRTGALWRPNGHYFDPTDDQIVITDHSALRLTTYVTIELWYCPNTTFDSSATAYRSFCGKTGGNQGYTLRLEPSAGKAHFYLGDNATYHHFYSAKTSWAANTWFHIVATYDQVNGSLYVDGNLDLATPNAGISIYPKVIDMHIGTGNPIDGIVGEFRIYSRALSAVEIQRNYLATKWRYR